MFKQIFVLLLFGMIALDSMAGSYEPSVCHESARVKLVLNTDQFSIGDRLKLDLRHELGKCVGPWDIFLSIKKAGSDELFLPSWDTAPSPMGRSIKTPKQSVATLLDIVVDSNLLPGKYTFTFRMKNKKNQSYSMDATRDFIITNKKREKNQIHIDLGKRNGHVRSWTGFLHGLHPRAAKANKKIKGQLSFKEVSQYIKGLRPAFWRLDNEYVHKVAIKSGAKVTVVLGDLMGGKNARPWTIENGCTRPWQCFERDVRSKIRELVRKGRRPQYWDLWNEPDGEFWAGSDDQFFEMVRRVVPVIREESPGSKIVGPSTADNPIKEREFYNKFFSFLNQEKIRLDGIAWHEFHRPEDIPIAADWVNQQILKIPTLKNAELHIGEYSAGQHHLIPAWQLGYIYYMDSANIDWATRGCWYWKRPGGGEPVSECTRGLDGLLHPATLEPLPSYWVYQWLAEMNGKRLSVDIGLPRTVAMAAADESNSSIQILVGRYSCGEKLLWCRFHGSHRNDKYLEQSNTELMLSGFPENIGRVPVTMERISAVHSEKPMKRPQVLHKKQMQLKKGILSIPLNRLMDGDVVRIKIGIQK